MISKSRGTRILALCLAGLAGYVDALGFMSLGGVFVSFMSGNSTRAAVALAEHNFTASALLPLGIIGLFVLGVMAGTIMGHLAKRRSSIILACVSGAILLGALSYSLGVPSLAIVCVVLAMGLENNTFVKDGEVEIGVTYMTGTLVKFGQRLAGSFLGGHRWGWVPYLMLWLGLMAGAVLGSLSYALFNLNSLWIAGAFSLSIFAGSRFVDQS